MPTTETSQTDAEELALMVNRTQTAIAVLQAATDSASEPITVPTDTATVEPSITPTQTQTLAPTPTVTITPTPQPEDCTNKAKFVEETIPDQTSMGANKAFTKTWTLQNVGSCTWTNDYALIFVDGDQMGGSASSQLNQTVQPQSTVIISTDLVAPSSSGVYQGNWKLRSASGNEFGLENNANKSFWVKIKVTETTSELNLGNPTWTDGFDSDSGFWQLGKDSFIEYKLASGNLEMITQQKIGDQWRMNGKPAVKNMFLEVNFKTGKTCAGKDSYGVIVRSTDTGDDIFDSGYVFSFSCDGMYRLYRMDNGTYIGLLNWTSSSDINSGPDKDNRMGIFIQDNQIKIYANGSRLAQIADDGHSQGKWGLSIRSVETTEFSVSVQDVSYWVLAD